MARQYLVPAVTRALEVMELWSKQDSGMSISEIHRALGLPLSSAANIVYTLQSLGYLERDAADSRYQLSLKMLGVSRRVPGRMDFLGRCHGLLEHVEIGFNILEPLSDLQSTVRRRFEKGEKC